MCPNKPFPSKRLIIQHSTFSFNGASYIIRTFHVIDESLELPKQTRSPYTALKHTIKSPWLDLHPLQAHISLNRRRPLPVTRVIYNICTDDLTSPLCVKHVWRPCDKLPGVVVSGKTQQSSFGATHGRALRFLRVPASFKDKTVNPETPGALNCRSQLWSCCLRWFPGIPLTDTCTNKAFFFCVFFLREWLRIKNWSSSCTCMWATEVLVRLIHATSAVRDARHITVCG